MFKNCLRIGAANLDICKRDKGRMIRSSKPPQPGDELRDHAADLLRVLHSSVATERRAKGKKVDLYFEREDYGRTERVYVEAKDYSGPLQRAQVRAIWGDYEMIVQRAAPSMLLIVTRYGLTPDADMFVNQEHSLIRHRTIWELENEVLNLRSYVESITPLYDEEGLSTYYVEANACELIYDKNNERLPNIDPVSLFDSVRAWINGPNDQPIAILGGYGAGKSSFARRLATHLATRSLSDPTCRRPVIIPLGIFTGHTRLEGALGGKFTFEFPIRDFNMHRFLELNKRGRLIIILDGFDEMKHAMTFADFRAQLTELNKLVTGNSRVILLGRPSAFLSNEEQSHVLRGRVRFGTEGWRRLPDWPVFKEYEIQPFTPSERSQFIHDYLRYAAKRETATPLTEEQISARAVLIQSIAEANPDVFSKPVHAKILTDLGADVTIELDRLERGLSRWSLYDLFFTSLAGREVQKEARRPISDDVRIRFERDIAHWLWSERSGVTYFAAHDLPDAILAALPDGDSADEGGKKREYLTGSFLDSKGDDTYYFPHRSFAEFLVAQWITLNPPAAATHPQYSKLMRDGVVEFLLDSPSRNEIQRWVSTLTQARGELDLAYLDSYRRTFTEIEAFKSGLDNRSWSKLVDVFDGELSLEALDDDLTWDLVAGTDDVCACLALSLLVLKYFSVDALPGDLEVLSARLVASLFERLFVHERHYLDFEFRIPPESTKARDLVSACVKRLPGRAQSFSFQVDWAALRDEADVLLRERGPTITMETEVRLPRPLRVADTAIWTLMTRENAEKARDYFLRHYTMEGLKVRRAAR